MLGLGFLVAPDFVVRRIYYLKISILIIPFDVIYHTSKHFCTCVGAGACNCTPLLKRPADKCLTFLQK